MFDDEKWLGRHVRYILRWPLMAFSQTVPTFVLYILSYTHPLSFILHRRGNALDKAWITVFGFSLFVFRD